MTVDRSSAAFDPSDLGTCEAIWRRALAHIPRLTLPRGQVLVVSPHPDDEVLGAGGLISTVACACRPVIVLSVTDGEAAYPDWVGLGEVRSAELGFALRKLTRYASSHRLGIPDGNVAGHRAALFDAIESFMTPQTMLVAPHQSDGHPDHEATGEVCREIARRRDVPLWRYPIWLWHRGSPNQLGGQVTGRIELDYRVRKAKARAISAFVSQLRPPGRKPIVPPHVLSYFQRPYEIFFT